MRKKYLKVLLGLLVAVFLAGCCSSVQFSKRDMGNLQTAVGSCASAIKGEYPDSIPGDLTAEKFMNAIKGKIPSDYYKALKEYPIDVHSLGVDYLLVVYSDERNKKIIMFDYSCTPKVDGRVYVNPDTFDVNHLEKYNPCK
jgi:hypothetical protein